MPIQKSPRLSRLPISCVALSLLLGGLAPSAFAVTQATFSTATNAQFYDPDISATDLINAGQPSFGTLTSTIQPAVGNLTSFNNGAGQDYATGTSGLVYWDGTQNFGAGKLADFPQVTVTFNLNPATGGSATGYDLSNITSIYGWGDHASFNDQSFKIEWAPASSPTSFVTLYTVSFGPFDPAADLGTGQPSSSKVILTNLGVTGAGALRFTFSPYFYNGTTEQGGQTLHEMDVFGTASAVPEPTSAGLAVTGLLLLILRRRSIRRQA